MNSNAEKTGRQYEGWFICGECDVQYQVTTTTKGMRIECSHCGTPHYIAYDITNQVVVSSVDLPF